MSAVLVGRFEPGSEAWHAARADGVGGSEVAAILGLSPYESRFSLWHRKARMVGPVEETEIMDAGKRLEPAILGKFADDHGEWRVGASATFHHVDRPWQIANPDGLVYHTPEKFHSLAETWRPDSLVECKFALYEDQWGEPGTDQIPVHYQCQAQWYLDVFGLDTCHVMVFIGSQGVFREYVVTANERDQKMLRDAARSFLDSLATGERPPVDSHAETYSVIKELHPDINGDRVELDRHTAATYCTAKAAEKAAKEHAKYATSLVADAMGDAKTATHLGQTIATRQARGNGNPYVVSARNLPTLPTLEEEAS